MLKYKELYFIMYIFCFIPLSVLILFICKTFSGVICIITCRGVVIMFKNKEYPSVEKSRWNRGIYQMLNLLFKLKISNSLQGFNYFSKIWPWFLNDEVYKIARNMWERWRNPLQKRSESWCSINSISFPIK